MQLRIPALVLVWCTLCCSHASHFHDPDSFDVVSSKKNVKNTKSPASSSTDNEASLSINNDGTPNKQSHTLMQVSSCTNSDNSFDIIMNAITKQLKTGYNHYVLYLHFTDREIDDLLTYPSKSVGIKVLLASLRVGDAENLMNVKITHNLVSKRVNENTWLHYLSGLAILAMPIIFMILGVLSGMYSLLYTLRRISYPVMFSSFSVVVFTVQFTLEVMMMYEVEVLKHSEEVPSYCRKEPDFTWYQVSALVGSYFTIDHDQCSAYKKNVYISPLFKVKPMGALSNTFVTIITSPLVRIAETVNSIIKAVTIGIPMWQMVPMVVGLCVFSICIFIVYRGYRFRSILFSIEPMQAKQPQPMINYMSDQPSIKFHAAEQSHLKRLKSNDVFQKNRKYLGSKLKSKFLLQSKYQRPMPRKAVE